MTYELTFQVAKQNSTQQSNFKIKIERLSYINSIIDCRNTSITESQVNELRQLAARSGKADVIERSDLENNAEEKGYGDFYKKGYDDLYDIRMSADGKFYEITVKKTNCFYPDPDGKIIKKDFGLKDGVLIDNNQDVFPENPTNETRSFDAEKIKGGTVLRLPVGEVNFKNGPSGFWGRMIHTI